jgi:hypothetical protein
MVKSDWSSPAVSQCRNVQLTINTPLLKIARVNYKRQVIYNLYDN